MINITDHGAITSTNIELVGDEHYPAYMNVLKGYHKGVKVGMRLPVQNMADQLFRKYPHLLDIGKGKKTGLFVGSGASEWAGMSRCMTEATPDYSCKVGFYGLINISAGALAHRMQIEDYLATDATACVSSLKCIQDASFLINAGIIERAVVLGWDDQINSCVREVFGKLGASISKEEYENGRLPSAFRKGNGGFLVGAGIGYVILEKHGTDPIAEILGISTLLSSSSSPINVKSDGYIKTMRASMKDAQIQRPISSVHVLKSHGTGTCSNNEAEGTAIDKVLPHSCIVTSYKPIIGHTMGASGVIELSMLLDDYKRNSIRGILNKDHDPQFINKETPPPGNIFMTNASGMGGVYTSMVGKWLG
jgi:3-oxoacyl-(acyl-carrier-protein) synthase